MIQIDVYDRPISRSVRWYGYSTDAGVLIVGFRDNRTFSYDAPPEAFAKMKAAGSKGEHAARLPGLYRWRRIPHTTVEVPT